MEVWEWTLTIALPLAALLWGSGSPPPEGHLVSGRVEHSAPRGESILAGQGTVPSLRNLCHGLRPWPVSSCCTAASRGEDLPLLLGLGIFGAMVVLSLVLPRLCPKRYRHPGMTPVLPQTI